MLTPVIITKPQENSLNDSLKFRQTYHELSEQHILETDVLVQLKANLAQLEDLHGRLRFMMGEISYLLRKA